MADRNLKNRVERFINTCKSDIESQRWGTLKAHTEEFNKILQLFHAEKRHLNITPIYYVPDDDEQYYGGISDEGKSKFRSLVTKAENLIDNKIRKNAFMGTNLEKVLAVLFSGLVIFFFGFFYNLGGSMKEKSYDKEKNELYERNRKLIQQLDSCERFNVKDTIYIIKHDTIIELRVDTVYIEKKKAKTTLP